jgi:hypothetical protein
MCKRASLQDTVGRRRAYSSNHNNNSAGASLERGGKMLGDAKPVLEPQAVSGEWQLVVVQGGTSNPSSRLDQ